MIIIMKSTEEGSYLYDDIIPITQLCRNQNKLNKAIHIFHHCQMK